MCDPYPARGMGDGALSGSFEEFYAAHFSALSAQLRTATGDLSEAQDIVQEAFTRAWPRWERLVAYDDPVAWVRRVAWNLAMSRWRRARTAARFLRRSRPEIVDGPEPDRVVLTAALATLPLSHRRAIVLYYMAGLTSVDIARECGVSEATVRSWLYRGRAGLLAQLSERPAEVRR